MHVHAHEDEYSYVLEGEVGVQIGDDVRYAQPGDLVVKPRGIPHAFWNRTDEPARLLEIISPGGFERYFAELAPLLAPAGRGARFRGARRAAGTLRAGDGHGLGGDDREREGLTCRMSSPRDLPPSTRWPPRSTRRAPWRWRRAGGAGERRRSCSPARRMTPTSPRGRGRGRRRGAAAAASRAQRDRRDRAHEPRARAAGGGGARGRGARGAGLLEPRVRPRRGRARVAPRPRRRRCCAT